MSKRSEQTKEGLRRAKARGQRLGRKQTSINLVEVQARLAAGESQRAIAGSLGVSPALLSKRLKTYREQLEQQEQADFAAIFGE